MKKPLVIAIAAVSGGGKTTVTKALNSKLRLSKALYFDDYDFEGCPEDFFKWVEAGADYNLWNTEILVKDLKCLLSDQTLEYILLDYPFAYKNYKMAEYIDYTVFIDTPLDIAMARRILRDKTNDSSIAIKEDLSSYLSKGRVAYIEMIKTIKPNSDLVIDGVLEIEEIVSEIILRLKE